MELTEVAVAGVDRLGAYALVRLADDVPVGPPGTFAMVRDPVGAAFLPRPVGLFRAADGRPAFLIDPSLGIGSLARAERLAVLSPLGRGFVLEGAEVARALLVAGGIGITVFAGVRAARLVAGFRSPEHAVATSLVDAPATIRLAPALVTDDLDLDGIAVVLASGPAGMVRAVAAVAAAAGVPCQVALEAPMACGFGACYGCAVRLDGTWKRLCIEGPVVAAERLT